MAVVEQKDIENNGLVDGCGRTWREKMMDWWMAVVEHDER